MLFGFNKNLSFKSLRESPYYWAVNYLVAVKKASGEKNFPIFNAEVCQSVSKLIF